MPEKEEGSVVNTFTSLFLLSVGFYSTADFEEIRCGIMMTISWFL